MDGFATKRLLAQPDAIAPDGSDVRILLQLPRGSLAHFEISPGASSIAVAHRTSAEIWYFLKGRGEMWRRLGSQEDVVPIECGAATRIPVGTYFQFRSFGYELLSTIGTPMPPWASQWEEEYYEVPGKWTPTLGT